MDFFKSNVAVCLIQECSDPELDKRIIETVTVQTQGNRLDLVLAVGL